jgi:hypothetical protein
MTPVAACALALAFVWYDASMWRLLAGFALLFAASCGRERGVPPSAGSVAPPSRSGPVAPEPVAANPGVPCLTSDEIERDLGVGFKLESELAVVRVAPDDVLNLREKPGALERVVGKLAYDTRGVRATGRVCRVGETEWFEVSAGEARGFANGGFLMPATAPVDETERMLKLLGGDGRFGSADALARALAEALERPFAGQTEPRLQAKVMGAVTFEKPALVLVCCFADDSIQGEQIVVEFGQGKGYVTLRRALVSRLCPRGASGDRCI